jgi:hypothetical protein
MNLFFKNPYDDQSAVMQDMLYYCRWEQYMNALAHMFNTGFINFNIFEKNQFGINLNFRSGHCAKTPHLLGFYFC